MSDSITDRITVIIGGHTMWPSPGGGGLLQCLCGLDMLVLSEWAAHVAGAIVEQFGLIPQWAAATDDPDRPGAWSEFVHTGDYRADAQEDADALDGGYVVTRYVTKWEAE